MIDGTDPDLVASISKNLLEKDLQLLKMKYEAAIEGVLALQAGDNPHMVEEKMAAKLP